MSRMIYSCVIVRIIINSMYYKALEVFTMPVAVKITSKGQVTVNVIKLRYRMNINIGFLPDDPFINRRGRTLGVPYG